MSTESKYTPGPWNICLSLYDGAVFSFSITAPPHGSVLPICEAPSRLIGHNRPPEELEANARLIAAAPDLLAALKDLALAYKALRKRSGYDDDASDSLDIADAAIAKAEGRP